MRTIYVAVLLSALAPLTANAVSWNNAPPPLTDVMFGKARPSYFIDSEFHGTHRVYIDDKGLPFKTGNEVSYLAQTDCATAQPRAGLAKPCNTDTKSVFDGLSVERLSSEECLARESTVEAFNIVRKQEKMTYVPRVLIREWRLACPTGLR